MNASRGASRRQTLAIALWASTALVLGLVWSWPQIQDWLTRGPRAAMPEDCHPRQERCLARFDDSREVSLRVTSSTVARGRKLTFRITAPPGPEPRLLLTGENMNMGLFELRLRPDPDGGWMARGYLPLCTKEDMRWRADVRFDEDDALAQFWFQGKQTQ